MFCDNPAHWHTGPYIFLLGGSMYGPFAQSYDAPLRLGKMAETWDDGLSDPRPPV